MAAKCKLKRIDISKIVVEFVRSQDFPNAVEESDFENDVPVDAETRAGWADPIVKGIVAAGCQPEGFGPTDCENAETVGDIVDAAFKAVQ